MNHAAQPWVRKEVIGNATLYLGDCLEILPALSGVNVVITDPPYPREYLKLYKPCWEAADICMVDGAVCFAMVGQMYLPEVFKSFPDRWEYIWTGCFEQRQQNGTIWPRGISTGWKPMLIYGKGFKKFKPWKYDVIGCSGNYQKPKELHEWGQADDQFRLLAERFEVSGTVLDPFMGSATTGVVCLNLGMKFIGVEIDERSFDVSCERLASVQGPPPILQERMFA
jgi:hypothetical protein